MYLKKKPFKLLALFHKGSFNHTGYQPCFFMEKLDLFLN